MNSKAHIGDCSKCGDTNVVIAYGWSTRKRLCAKCNQGRMREANAAWQGVYRAKKKIVRQIGSKCVVRKPVKKAPTKRHGEDQAKDSKMNREIWQDRKHVCFECDSGLRFPGFPPKWVFSHVHSKGARKDLRHVKLNVVLHCRGCHNVWEFGAREFMPKTLKLFEKIAVEHQDNKFDRK